MKYYFKEFIKGNFKEKSNAYLFVLWSSYKNLESKGRISNYIKEELDNLDLSNIEEKRRKGESVVLKLEIKKGVSHFKKYPYIESIQIKDFKGFGSQNDQDKGTFTEINRYNNIFFGPNGAGKTSFCEALEYTVTSDIKERKRRSIPLKDYIKRNGSMPFVNVTFNNKELDGDKITDFDKEFFHRCFIEKNRLQEFSLLGSKDTGVKGSDIIANLLGLHELDDLLSSFVKPNSFKLDEFLRNDVAKRRRESEEKNQQNLAERKVLNEQKLKLLTNTVKNYYLIDDRNIWIDIENLEEMNKTRVDILSKQKEALIHKELIDFDSSKIFNEIEIMKKDVKHYKELKEKITAHAIELNYESFYRKLSEIEKNDEFCPACDTPLSKVVTNPFEKANLELEKLKEITKMKKQLDKLISVLENRYFDFLMQLIRDVKTNMSNFEQLHCLGFSRVIEELENSFYKKIKSECVQIFVGEGNLQEGLQVYFNNHINLSSEMKKNKEVSTEIEQKIRESENIVSGLSSVKSQIALLEEDLMKINCQLINFETDMKALRELEEKENTYNNFVADVEDSYKEFHQDLTEFKLKLESDQISDIEGKILEYYNLINKHDEPSESVNNINFKVEDGNYRIFINKGIDNQVVDAHALLSEGHLRSLGLSIMLAVAEKNKVPFIVFDDVVNAIDSDHRANIIDMMFNNSFLRKTQQIITTHDRLFWERYCNSFSKVNGKKQTSIISHIFKSTNTGTIIEQYEIDFESKIISALNNYDIRQALVYCRIWFESIATNYCVENNLEMTGRFTHDKTSNHLKASLESIYEILLDNFKGNEDLSTIKNDIINWKGQNQEHHSFDEHSYNFVHSKNSDEVSKTFNAIRRFANDLDKEKSILRISKEVERIEVRLVASNKLLNNDQFLEKAPKEVIDKEKQKNGELLAEKSEFEAELIRLGHVSEI